MTILTGNINFYIEGVENKTADAICTYCKRKIEEIMADRDLFVDDEFEAFIAD